MKRKQQKLVSNNKFLAQKKLIFHFIEMILSLVKNYSVYKYICDINMNFKFKNLYVLIYSSSLVYKFLM